jgi:hypothetical protein
MPEPVAVGAGIAKIASSASSLKEGRRRARLRTHPLHVTVNAVSNNGTVRVEIHADNDSDHGIEVKECYVRRLRTTGGCGEPDVIRDATFVPLPLRGDADGPTTIPPMARRSWRFTVAEAEIARVVQEELDAADARIFAPELAQDLERDRDAKSPSNHPLARFDAPRMRIWGVVSIGHRDREFSSKKHCDIPPVVAKDVLKDWWDQRLEPRVAAVRARVSRERT